MSNSSAGRRSPEHLIEEDLSGKLHQLGSLWDADMVSFIGPIAEPLDDIIRDEIEAIQPRKSRLGFIIETPGGYIETAERIANVLRHHYDTVDFIVPNASMSAGTVLVMSGDAIYMDYFSVLGPIDPQVRGRNGQFIPALGYLSKYDELVKKSATPEGLTDAEITYLLQRFDPAELYQYEQARQQSETLLKEWLAKYKFKAWGPLTRDRKIQVTDDLKSERAEEIAKALNDTERWHSHSRGISMEVLDRDINLLINDLEEEGEEFYGTLRAYYKLLKDYLIRRSKDIVVHREDKFFTFPGGVE